MCHISLYLTSLRQDEAVQQEERIRKTAGFRRINILSLANDRNALLKSHRQVERLREILERPPPPPPAKPDYMERTGSSGDLPEGVYPPIVSVVPFDEWKAAAPCFRSNGRPGARGDFCLFQQQAPTL